MQHNRILIVALVISALAISAIGTLAMGASSKTLLVAVNGVPGVRADMCINGQERVSGLRYGSAVKLEINNSAKKVKFTRAAAGRPCSGAFLGKKKFDPPAQGSALTLVVTKQSPQRVVMFDDTVPVDPGDAVVAWRQASDLGLVDISYQQLSEPSPIPPQLAASPSPTPFAKGDEFIADVGVGDVGALRVIANKTSNGKRLARTRFYRIKAARFNQTILLGTKGRNARFAQVKSPIRTPSP